MLLSGLKGKGVWTLAVMSCCVMFTTRPFLSPMRYPLMFGRARFQKITSRSYSRTQVEDARPSWVYVTSKLLSYTVIPTIAAYGVFFHDFGDREHVFQPVRRWARRQFFSLTPEEQRLLTNEKSPDGPSQ